MALQPSIEVCFVSNCESIQITETTGAYSATLNTGGYGSPNLALASVDTAELIITSYSSSGVATEYDTIDMEDYSFPDDADITAQIDAEDLLIDEVNAGLTSFSDGVWKFRYKITSTAGVVYNAVAMKLATCSLHCRLLEQAVKIADDSCGCCGDKHFLNQFLEAYTVYRAMVLAGACGSSILDINKNLLNLNDALSVIKCKNC